MILLITGIDPRRVLHSSENQLLNQLGNLADGVPSELIKVILQCVKHNPSNRPSLDSVRTEVKRGIDLISDRNGDKNVSTENKDQIPTLRLSGEGPEHQSKLIQGAMLGLLNDVILEKKTGFWLSPVIDSYHISLGKEERRYQLHRSAHRGISGVVYLFGLLAKYGYTDQRVEERVKKAVQWLLKNKGQAPDADMPGLHFGEAGVAVALSEVISGGLIERSEDIDAFLLNALDGKLDWPDFTHDAAGQGIASFYCADTLNDPRLLRFSHRCADYLIKQQKADGSWEMPQGVNGMTGLTFTGFAHGVAGIVYFLAEYSRRFNSNDAYRAWKSGADWLIGQARPSEDGLSLNWNYSSSDDSCWKWWCHGSPGIALTFLRLYEQTGKEEYAEVAARALSVHPIDLRYSNLSQCHGLSGIGEIYLEAGRVLRDLQWDKRADSIANVIVNLRHEKSSGAMTWLVEDTNFPTADLEVGSGGVLHFLLRIFQRDRIGCPLMLNPIG
jgi:Lanthionine synthetase C-like protein